MASLGSKTYASHGKLHKRAGSTSSSIQSPTLPPALEHFPSDYKSSAEFRPVNYTDEQWEIQSKGSNKIRPYLRKLSSKDENRIDLSRTTEENERIAGLGIGDYTAASRSVSDVSFVPVNGRSRHGRTTSNGSQFSVSSLQRPTVPYAHPMRQTPRPYTPPIAKSYSNSLMSDPTDEPTDLIMLDDSRSRLFSLESHTRTGSVGSPPAHPPPLHIHTSNSFTRLNASQSSIPSSAPPIGTRSRGDTLRSMETIGTPSSARPSIDKAMSSFLHRSKSSTDELDAAASRAASIRALRAAYNEKEEAKEAKYEHRRAKKEERQRRKSDAATTARVRSGSNAQHNNSKGGSDAGSSEKGEIVGKAYTDYSATHVRSLPKVETSSGGVAANRPRGGTGVSRGSSNRGAKSTWVRFLAWLRTRFLRWGNS